jgi:hypothetical protein
MGFGENDPTTFIAPLADRPRRTSKEFVRWWSDPVLVDDGGTRFSRHGLVRAWLTRRAVLTSIRTLSGPTPVWFGVTVSGGSSVGATAGFPPAAPCPPTSARSDGSCRRPSRSSSGTCSPADAAWMRPLAACYRRFCRSMPWNHWPSKLVVLVRFRHPLCRSEPSPQVTPASAGLTVGREPCRCPRGEAPRSGPGRRDRVRAEAATMSGGPSGSGGTRGGGGSGFTKILAVSP